MATFATRGNSFLAGHVLSEIAPASGSTVQLIGGTDTFITSGSTTAALTLRLPGGARGDEIVVKTVSAITTLTWQTPNGTATTANGLPATLAAAGKVVLKYSPTLGAWTVW